MLQDTRDLACEFFSITAVLLVHVPEQSLIIRLQVLYNFSQIFSLLSMDIDLI